MRIVHFIPTLDSMIGGPARAVVDLAGLLVRRGHKVTIATFNCGDFASLYREADSKAIAVPEVHVLPKPEILRVAFDARTRSLVREIVNAHDVVHLHGIWEYSLYEISAIARARSVPYIISPRGMLDQWSIRQKKWKKRLYLWLVGYRMLRAASAIHLTADAELAQSERWFAPAVGNVVLNFLDLRPFKELPGSAAANAKFGLEATDFRVLFLSRLHEKKGADILIRAAALLAHSGCATFRILIAGSGDPTYVRDLRNLTEDLGVANRVSFLGNVAGMLKLSLYEAADLLVIPTSQENFGFVFFEALACALPLVTTQDVDLREELESSGAAILCERSPESVSNAILAMFRERRSLARIGEMGRKWVFGALDENAIGQRFDKMYGEAVSTMPED